MIAALVAFVLATAVVRRTELPVELAPADGSPRQVVEPSRRAARHESLETVAEAIKRIGMDSKRMADALSEMWRKLGHGYEPRRCPACGHRTRSWSRSRMSCDGCGLAFVLS